MQLFILSSFIWTDILPVKESSDQETKQFLESVVKICLKFIVESNDRKNKVLDFHQPDDLFNLYDFTIPSEPLNLEQLIKDCSECLRLQVKTGKLSIIILLHKIHTHKKYSHFYPCSLNLLESLDLN